jgi:acyl dehydratase
MKAYGGMDVKNHIFLTLALAAGEWSVSFTAPFTPGERAPGTHWIGGWVDLRAGLDNMEKRKFLTLPGLELQLPQSSSP